MCRDKRLQEGNGMKDYDKKVGEDRQIWDLLEEDLKKNEGSSNHFYSLDLIHGKTLADLFSLSSRAVHLN